MRNAMDHGLEPPEARRPRASRPGGWSCARAPRGGRIVIEVADDGAA
jgi:chemotaxis protein histidine kinase CheA